MGRLFILWVIGAALGVVQPAISFAQHGHGASKSPSSDMETKEVLVEGIRAVFQVMNNQAHKKMLAEMKGKEEPEAGTTHNIGVTLVDEKTRKTIMDAQVNMKLVDPAGTEQIKMLRPDAGMRNHNAYFKLSNKGKYQVMILFRIGDLKRSAGVYYELK